MAGVLTAASTLQCIHKGTLVVQASQQALTVDGQPVLVQADLLAATVAGCTNNNPAAGQAPCLAVTAVSAGLSSTLSVGHQPVVLETAQGLTNGTPPAPVMWQVASAGQTKLGAT